ncbi:MAG: ABC transporter permease [bacterium]
MGTFIVRRLLQTIPVLLGVITVTFVLMRVVPGDPVDKFAGQRISDEMRTRLRAQWHLDDPALVQFGYYLKGLLFLDFGDSWFHNQTVRQRVFSSFLKTCKLAAAAMLFAIVLGVGAGIVSSVFKDSIVDRIAIILALLGISTPVFWFGMILIIVMARLGWTALSGDFGLEYLILPAITLGARSVAYLARMTRASMLEVLRMDYLTTARAKGLREHIVIVKHAMKNALIPIVTVIGLDFASYLNGAVLTEKVFAYPGLGLTVVNSILERDLPVVMGSVILMTIVFVLMNLIVDLIYGLLDPRIRIGG